MAIAYPDKEKDNVFEISNGHLEKLRGVQKAYNIESDAKTLSFLIAVGSEAKGEPIKIKGRSLAPSDAIKRER